MDDRYISSSSFNPSRLFSGQDAGRGQVNFNERDFEMTSGARARTATAPAASSSGFAPQTIARAFEPGDMAVTEDDASGWNDVREALQAAERQSVAAELPLPAFRTTNGLASASDTFSNMDGMASVTRGASSHTEAGSSNLLDLSRHAPNALPDFLTSPFPAAVSLPAPPLKPFDPWSSTDSPGHSSVSTSNKAFTRRIEPEPRSAQEQRSTFASNHSDIGYITPSSRSSNIVPGPPAYRHQSFPPRVGPKDERSFDGRYVQARQAMPQPLFSSQTNQPVRPRFQPHNSSAYQAHPASNRLPRLDVSNQVTRKRVLSEGAEGHSPTLAGAYGFEVGPGLSSISPSGPFGSPQISVDSRRPGFSTSPQANSLAAGMRPGPTMQQRQETRMPPSPLTDVPLDSASLKPPAGLKLRSGLPERTSYAMWVGNVPTDATEQELWGFFLSRAPLPTAPGGLGLQSIHLIARSQCAFLNLDSEEHLFHMIAQCHGVTLRPNDVRCKPLVCRVRRTEDDAKSGVGAQRGGGLHKAWVKENGQGNDENEERDLYSQIDCMKDQIKADDEDQRVKVGNELEQERESIESTSSGSTDSGFFHRHFPKRYFILKSHNQFDLEQSVKHGYWSTQAHNEPVLDQAFRTASQGVYIIFSANKSGNCARMAGPIYPSSKVDGQNGALPNGEQNNSPVPSLSSPVPRSAFDQLGTETSSAIRRPFRVDWLTSQSVPFVRTRHLSNSFNSNREVKICRDGTEVEPIAGEQLVREVMRRAPTPSIAPPSAGTYTRPDSTTLPTAPVF
ncbi:hypothetical protein OIV83_005377 [Microbotryomycetes sp. JL201]|nr:hypothetical protein OIV83_005377 [Microbotryomycetes sp. JL201]